MISKHPEYQPRLADLTPVHREGPVMYMGQWITIRDKDISFRRIFMHSGEEAGDFFPIGNLVKQPDRQHYSFAVYWGPDCTQNRMIPKTADLQQLQHCIEEWQDPLMQWALNGFEAFTSDQGPQEKTDYTDWLKFQRWLEARRCPDPETGSRRLLGNLEGRSRRTPTGPTPEIPRPYRRQLFRQSRPRRLGRHHPGRRTRATISHDPDRIQSSDHQQPNGDDRGHPGSAEHSQRPPPPDRDHQ